MFRIHSLLFVLVLCAFQCESVVDTELSKLEGKWALYKIGVGYPVPNGPSELKPTETEILEIDAKNETLVRTINGAVTEESKIEISKQPISSPNPRLSLVFLKSKTYSFLHIDDKKGEISLYQQCPLEAELADGNTYFYKKL